MSGQWAGVSTALALAARHPSIMLPCPVCVASVRAENLSRHLGKAHQWAPEAGAAPGPELVWTGRDGRVLVPVPARLSLESGTLLLVRLFGLGRRRVTRPALVEIGGLVTSRAVAGMSSYADDFNVPHEEVRTGTYLRLSGDGAVVVACRNGGAVRRHWAGWSPGTVRRGSHIRLDPRSFVALQYALVDLGVLTPRSVESS